MHKNSIILPKTTKSSIMIMKLYIAASFLLGSKNIRNTPGNVNGGQSNCMFHVISLQKIALPLHPRPMTIV